MKIFRQSLRSKLIGVFLLPTFVSMVLYGFLAYFATRHGLEDELGKRLVAVGQAVSAQWSEGIDADQLARLDESKQRVISRLQGELIATRDRTEVRRIFVFDANSQSLLDSEPNVAFGSRIYELEPHRREVRQVFDHATASTSVLFAGEDGVLYKTGFVPVTSEGQVVAAIGVEASASYFDLLTNFASALTFLAILALLLIVVVATVFSRRLVAPINNLVDAAHRLGRGELHEPVAPSGGEDEIAFLSSAFEEMRRDIVQRDDTMQLMLSGIAHEVRNPLGGMELFCGLLREDLLDSDSPAQNDMLDKVGKIQRELTYLDRVVNDFLDFARDVPLECERFDAASFVDEVRDLLGGEVFDGGATLRVSAGDEVELTADRQKLRRALINIVRNAAQAGATTIDVDVTAAGDDRILTVTDDGPGIPAERLEEVFAPFVTTKEKGSGLGLALTRRIVAQHRGTMELTSEVGSGTTVRFVLPFDESLEASAAAIPEGWLG